jgi:hypothetical protein
MLGVTSSLDCDPRRPSKPDTAGHSADGLPTANIDLSGVAATFSAAHLRGLVVKVIGH